MELKIMKPNQMDKALHCKVAKRFQYQAMSSRLLTKKSKMLWFSKKISIFSKDSSKINMRKSTLIKITNLRTGIERKMKA